MDKVSMYSYFKSETLKMKHTFVGRLIFLAPIFTLLLSYALTPSYFQIDSYNWWYVAILPGMLSLGCTLVARKDQKMNNRGVLPLPINLKKVWLAKVFVCALMLILSCMLLFLGSVVLGGVVNMYTNGSVSIGNSLAGSLCLAVTFLWQIPLCLFLSRKLGLFPTILINIGLYMVFGVLTSTEKLWWVIPYAIPARLMCPIIKVLPNGLPAVKGNMTYSPELLSRSVILPGIIVTSIIFIFLTIVTAKWYERQEAR